MTFSPHRSQFRGISDGVPVLDLKGLTDLKERIFKAHCFKVWCRTDKIFVGLLTLEWMATIVVALWLTPLTWIGGTSSLHLHVLAAVFLGGIIVAFPLFLVFLRSGQAVTRHVIAVSQMLFSGLLIDLSGGRIETHFHIFGSLAFLAFYRDWRVLTSASIVVWKAYCSLLCSDQERLIERLKNRTSFIVAADIAL